MNVLSLFDGMSCGRIALERAGIPVNNYFASEIDKYATQVSNDNYPDIIRLGDVSKIHYTNLGIEVDLPISMRVIEHDIDLIIGGSPCQGFSFAGKQLNFEDPRSKLFFEFVRILNEVRLKNHNVKFLLENVNMKQEYQDIISKHLGVEPIRINSSLVSAGKRNRLYWTNISDVNQPEETGVLLKDIIEFGYVDVDKSYCIDASYFKGGNCKQYFDKSRRQLVFLNENELNRAKYKYKGKTWKSGNKMGNMKFPDDVNKKSKSLCATIIKGARETIHIEDDFGIRILTPLECERIQTVPEGYTKSVSNTQRYKMLGNGWTVDVIAHIFKGLR